MSTRTLSILIPLVTACASPTDGNDPVACSGKCDSAAPDAGISDDAGSDATPPDGALPAGSVVIGGLVHNFERGIAYKIGVNNVDTWSFTLDNHVTGTPDENVEVFFSMKPGHPLVPGTYECGTAGADANDVTLSFISDDGSWGSEDDGASCTITISSVPTQSGDPVVFTFAGSLLDEDDPLTLTDGQGTAALR